MTDVPPVFAMWKKMRARGVLLLGRCRASAGSRSRASMVELDKHENNGRNAAGQECRMPHCDIMPRCDKMPQLHRFSWTAIEYSMVHSEGAPDLF